MEPTLENLKALTDDQAAAIYKREYWDRIKADQYPSQKLANFAFDFHVNSGGHAILTLQRVLRDMGQDIDVDGGVGPQTLGAIHAVDQDDLYKRYKEARSNFFKRIADRDPSQKRFLKGWLNRVNSFPD